MTIHRFLSMRSAKPPVMPSARWLEAFPEGSWGDLPTLELGASPTDVIWVPVTLTDWQDQVAQLVRTMPERAVVVMSAVPHDAEGLRAINEGARGYCHLHAQPALMQEVARAVQSGALWVGPELVDRLVAAARTLLDRVESARPDSDHSSSTNGRPGASIAPDGPDLSMLSPRELEVVHQVGLGKTNKEVARVLDITERTVKAHLGSAFEKLGVRDRLQLVLLLSPVSARPPQP
jgi:two-component system nitrate/nitrite response regulator NarL